MIPTKELSLTFHKFANYVANRGKKMNKRSANSKQDHHFSKKKYMYLGIMRLDDNLK